MHPNPSSRRSAANRLAAKRWANLLAAPSAEAIFGAAVCVGVLLVGLSLTGETIRSLPTRLAAILHELAGEQATAATFQTVPPHPGR